MAVFLEIFIFSNFFGIALKGGSYMKSSFKIGIGFGVTSGVITTLGLMVGLFSGTHLKLAVLGGILTIAIADAFSDALGIHISQESIGNRKHDEVWESTFSTLFTKFIVALTFVIAILFLDLRQAIIVNLVWGFLLLGLISFIVAKSSKINPGKVIGEHLLIAGVVIVITYYAGIFISSMFGGV